MPDTKQLLRDTRDRVAPPPDVLGSLERRRDRKHRDQRIRAAVLGLAIAIAVGWLGVNAIRSTPSVPADDRSEDLGIFAPVAGRILYENWGIDSGYDPGFWAVDPNGPSDTVPGPSVAEDVASTLERLDLEDAEPLGWSSDGTELLLMRSVGDGLFPEQYLSILYADGSETRLNEDPMGISDATISPDGTRVVFAGQYDLSGLYLIKTEGGRPVPLPIPQAGDGAGSPTFSPDGTRIAYLAGNGEAELWVANADGTDAHQILADEPTVFRGVSGPEWSPAGERLAIGLGTHERSGGSIYTFAPDGSDFTKVIVGGSSPSWSHDGSQIAYTIQCDEDPTSTCVQFDPQAGSSPAGLAIADADGSNVRAFGFAASGPWHPVAANEPAPRPTPTGLATCAGDTEACFGPLEEGTYTSQRFEPALTFTVPVGWNNPYDTRSSFDLWTPGWSDGWEDPDDRVIYLFDHPGLSLFRDVRPREGCSDGVYATVGTSAIEVATWVAAHPGIAAGPPSPVEIGGLSGYQLDVSIADTWQSCPIDGAQATVPLFDQLSLIEHPGYATMRLIVLDLPDGGNVLISIDGNQVDAAMPVVRSFAFDL